MKCPGCDHDAHLGLCRFGWENGPEPLRCHCRDRTLHPGDTVPDLPGTYTVHVVPEVKEAMLVDRGSNFWWQGVYPLDADKLTLRNNGSGRESVFVRQEDA